MKKLTHENFIIARKYIFAYRNHVLTFIRKYIVI